MSFDEWIEESQEIEDKSIFIIKNGIEYKIALTTKQKPKFKKHKMSGRKKFFISGIELLGIEVSNKEEITEIQKEDPSEVMRYDSMFAMQVHSFYTIHLTPKQYRHLTNFLDTERIELNEPFYFQRHGKMMNTNFVFYARSEIPKQSKLKGITKTNINPNEYKDIEKSATKK